MDREVGLRIGVADSGTAVAVRVGGELALDCVADLHAGLADYVARPSTHLLLDLTELEFCDSAGLGAIIGVRRAVCATGGTLTITGVSTRIARMLAHTGLGDYLGFRDPCAH